MEKNIFRFVLRYSTRQQVVILLLTLSSFPFLYYSLELPKQIVNDAIGGQNFPKEFFGYQFEQVPYLILLSFMFLTLVVVNGAFKFRINTLKGRLGERMLRRLRYELYARVIRFPLPRFRKVSQGEIIPMITAEVEPLGGFIGDSIALPVFQGGTLLVYLTFIFMQDPILGAAAVSLYPFQGWLIPRLQRKVNQLGKQRVRAMRQISDRIGESVSGMPEIHAHDTSAWHLADLSHRYGDVYDIRFEIFQRKFFIKFLNNFINQLTPFFFYLIGGYLVIKGSISFGSLVAVLAAYKDLAGPWKELLDYYQMKEDIRIKYEQVIEQFDLPELMPAALIAADADPGQRLTGAMVFSNVSFGEDAGPKVLDNVSCTLPLDAHTAIVGGPGRDEFAMLAARLLMPTGGRIRVGDKDLSQLPEAVTGRRIAYVGQTSYMFTASLRDNLYYGLRHRPLKPTELDERAQAEWKRRAHEAKEAGNTDFPLDADWIDYEAAGCDGPEALRRRTMDVLAMVDLSDDVYGLGLNGTLNSANCGDVVERILEARAALRAELAQPSMRSLVEVWNPQRYNYNATVAENLLFGSPVGPVFAIDSMAENTYVLEVLEKVGMTGDFLDMGVQVARTMIELFADLPPGHQFFEQFSFISSEDLPDFQPMVAKADKDGVDSLKPDEKRRLMALPFKLIPARHRLGLMNPDLERRLLEARQVFARDLPDALRGCVEFFVEDAYNAASTIQDNILFGKVAYGQAQVGGKVGRLMAQVIDELGLRETIQEIGLDHYVGVAGSRLSRAQRQKVALARGILKNPDLLVINEATAGLDGASQSQIHNAILEERQGRGVVWVLHRPSIARRFDQTLVLRGGQLAEHGSYQDLDKPGTVMHELLAAE
jgi:ABC-type multidrug transport system fused ATPase/permease subunit